MLIEYIFPQVIGAKSTLEKCFGDVARMLDIPSKKVSAIESLVPLQLRQAGCFLDKMTKTWRYEYGLPYELDDEFLWGTHMWPPVQVLARVLECVNDRLSIDQSLQYLDRLANHEKHLDTLVEMYPVLRVDPAMNTQFEVRGEGPGNSTIDWRIEKADGRVVLLDVKRRQRDLIELMIKISDQRENVVEPPDHDTSLLFRSVEKKFSAISPTNRLQGVWIVSDIKQEEGELRRAFDSLDKDKVHFAILGDWREDVHVLARRSEDLEFLLTNFGIKQSSRRLHRRGVPCL